MRKMDVVSQVCIFNDYPVWRKLMQDNRDKFDKIIMYPSRHHGVIDMEQFLREKFPETWVDPVPIEYGVEDWRQAETIPLLSHVTQDWVLFMEQDFFVDNWYSLWKQVDLAMDRNDAIGWWNATQFPYLHPCFLLIKRELLEKTQKDFSAHPEIPGCDHFAMITRDIEKAGGKIKTLQSMGFEPWQNAFHLGGLTYPYQNWKGDGTDHFGVGNIPAFYAYNKMSREVVGIPYDEKYLQLSLQIELQLEKEFPDIRLEANRWRRFFR
jgi:hypothetical protein